MFLTQRQKRILQLMLENPTGVSIKQIEENLKISRRTVYREFGDLKQNNFAIENQKGKYFLAGDTQALQKVKEAVQQSHSQNVISVAKREKVIAAKLLLSTEPCKVIQFALDLNVSEATIQSDLNTVEKSLDRYGITLVRKKGVGLLIAAPEKIRRQVLVDLLVNQINQYDFFKYLHNEIDSQDLFLTMIDKELLLQANECLHESVFKQIKLDTDQKEIEIILTVAIALKRSSAGCKLSFLQPSTDSLKYQGYVYQFLALFSKRSQLEVDQNDVTYLANKLLNSDYHNTYLTYDEHELAVAAKVKEFVQHISEEVHWDFQKNPDFMTKVTKHIIGLVQHKVSLLPDTPIEILQGLSQKFGQLYAAIQKYWQLFFPDNQLTSSELQLILLYFANEYTSQSNNRNLSALVICENGIGTSAILGAKLKREFTEIKQVKTSRVSTLNQLDLSNYNLIFSTLKLKGFPRDYLLVSPLLLDDELQKIRDYLKKYEQKYPHLSEQSSFNQQEVTHSVEKLSKISISALFSSELVNGIKVQLLEYNSSDLIAVVQECLAHLDPTLIRKQLPVAKNLLKRVQMAPVGIPNSQIALLHTRSPEITRCSFTMFDLDNEISLQSMDHNTIQVKRILLMLAPDNLSTPEQQVLSTISSMIIMSSQNLDLFTNGSQKEIQEAIANLILQDLKETLLNNSGEKA
ncbi:MULTISPECIES: HTH domain-containing protein [Lactobacillus]|uniref:HTH domain-containing protein n=1 Tax=Lactobacillus xujianguonis TaxID=2495899 RepID=A0A437STC5_9LACO|nr:MULTISPECIES: HTH domain-containing protein [Lactobacillus]RVU70196.1 HTH domain-containing protein [Lactobacillus xujianguonis]RVU76909.1 HTH domain-containing protein [Lactobacillus xujianguonis]